MTVEYDTRKISVDPPIYIYKRIDERGRVSRNWTYRFQVRFNPNPIRRSARTNDFEKAKRIALGAYYEAEHRVSTGKPIKKVSFGELCDDYVATLKGTKRSYYEGVIRRFLKPFFGKQLSDVSDLRQRHIVEYERWRQAYWTEGEGSTRSRFRYERNGKRIEAPVQNRGEPSANTWNREATVLRRLIEYAVDRELISRTDRPKVKSKPVEKRQRPHFTSQQWSKLHSVARAWIREASTEKQRETRQVLYDFIMFVANSGLRTQEALMLKWQNVDFKNAVIHVPENTKTGGRPVYAMPSAFEALRRLEKRRLEFLQQLKKGSQPSKRENVLIRASLAHTCISGKAVGSFKKLFPQLIERCGFEYDDPSERHTIYSLRHTYATFRLSKGGVRVHALAKSMGTGTRMIEAHYDHSMNDDYKDEMTRIGERRR